MNGVGGGGWEGGKEGEGEGEREGGVMRAVSLELIESKRVGLFSFISFSSPFFFFSLSLNYFSLSPSGPTTK